jgi:hypothetical protein
MSSRLAASAFRRRAFILASSRALAHAAYSAPRAGDDADPSAILKRQTRAFSEAGRRGDAATINRYLDRDVVFTNETGAIATYVVKISRDADGLTASASGGSPVPLKVEIKGVLLTQASPNVRKIFQRDAGGHVIGYINRRDGADLIFKKVA